MNLKLDFVRITLESHDERIYEKDLSIRQLRKNHFHPVTTHSLTYVRTYVSIHMFSKVPVLSLRYFCLSFQKRNLQ